MTYAIVETSGKQMWVEAGRFYDIDLVDAEPDTEIELRSVLLINHEGAVTLGQPYVAEGLVKGRILRHRRGKKIIVYKMKPKKKTRKKKGHRQELTRLLIESISLNGEVLAEGSLDTASQIEEIEVIASPEMIEASEAPTEAEAPAEVDAPTEVETPAEVVAES